MRFMTLIAVAVFAAGLSGCETGDSLMGMDEDGLRCDLPQVGDRVHIEIRYAEDGRPSAIPDECRVTPGTRITWRGPDDRDTPFVLRFPGGSPAGRDARRELPSSEANDRQKVMLVAGDVAARYKYDIDANGITVDPAIIIER